MGTYMRFLQDLQQTFYSYMHCIRTHKRYCLSRKTKPKQCFQAGGERITLTLIESIEKGVQVTTTDVKKTTTCHCAEQEAHF
jgi:hypothetical protein